MGPGLHNSISVLTSDSSISKLFLLILDILRVSRVEYWPGYIMYGLAWLKFFGALNGVTAALLSIFSVLVSGYGSLINVISDARYDARNPAKNYLSRVISGNPHFYSKLLVFYLTGPCGASCSILPTIRLRCGEGSRGYSYIRDSYDSGHDVQHRSEVQGEGCVVLPSAGYSYIFGSYILYFALCTGYPLERAALLALGYALVGLGATNVTNYVGDYYFDKRVGLNTAVVQVGVYPSLVLGAAMIVAGTVIAGSVSTAFYALLLTLVPYLATVALAWSAKEWDVVNLASPTSWFIMAVIPWVA